MRTSDGWKHLSSDPLIAVFEYRFGPGTANTLAVGVDGGLIVVSPPCRVADSVLARFAFRVSGSAPGLRMNRIAPLFMVRDRLALWRWLRAEVDRDPPRWLIPAHADVVDLSATPARLRDLFGPN